MMGTQSGQMGPGMMGNPGNNYGYGPGMMYNQSGNYSSGYGMMGNMMGNMMALYYPESKPITQDEALRNMQNFARQYYGSSIGIEDFMAFSSNYYAVLKDANSSQNIAEVLIDRYSGSTYLQYFTNWIRKSSSFIPISKYFSVKCLKS